MFSPLSQIHALKQLFGGDDSFKENLTFRTSVGLILDFGFVFFLVHLPTVQNDKMWSTFPQGLAGICG